LAIVLALAMGFVFGYRLMAQNSLLYSIEKEGYPTSYIYGTIHMLPQTDFSIDPSVTEALQNAQLVAMELDMDDPQMQANMFQHMLMKDEKDLKDFLSEEEYAELSSYAKAKAGINLDLMTKIKPFLVTSMLMPALFDEPMASYEAYFMEEAQKATLEIVGLETVEEQLSIFDEIPYEAQAEELLEFMKEEGAMKNIFEEILTHYKAKDVGAIEKMFDNYYDSPEQKEILLNQRNHNWIDDIQRLSKDQNVFYAVGAGHLGGQEGVLELLRKEGFTVRPVL
jgi:uncharacterized protein YbaP (TraB family)